MNDVVPLKQETSYRIKTRVKRVFQEEIYSNWRKNSEGKQECDTTYGGWFISLEGSYESLFLGEEKPTLEAGMDVYITISKAK
jgi:hypothetical protein